ncbi:MAG TPA: hypothetical protein VGX69_03215 [Solirubrobacteraceae bacterium]|jgi:hypothetical protein|nr:hypothetical protein [Solirubrobacteraceae bacterium]
MLGDSEVLRTALAKDVRHIYKRGSGALRSTVGLPDLTQLAEALNRTPSGDASSRRLVYELVRETIRHIAKDKKEHAGIVALLGLHRGSSPKVGDRQERAAPYLGYKNAESFRKTQLVSKQSSKERKVIDILLDRIVNALVIRALDAGLVVFTPPPPPPYSPPPPPPTRRHAPKSSEHLPDSLILTRVNGAIASEVRTALIHGIKRAVENDLLTILTGTANAAYGGHGSARNRIEALLTWAIASSASTSWDDRAVLALAGVGTRRQLSHVARRRRAHRLRYPTQSYREDDLEWLVQEVQISVGLSEPLWELATELEVPCGPCLSEMYANREYVTAPDPEVDGLLRLLLFSSLNLVDIDTGRGVVKYRDPSGVLTLR